MSMWEPPVFTVHRSRNLVWMPAQVQAIATRPDGRTLAVGREDGGVELRVPIEGYRVELRVPGQKGKGLRSLAWVDGEGGIGGGSSGGHQTESSREPARLFGCGLDGTVFEVDLVRLCFTNARDAYGGAAWCMRASSSGALLAVGCEDGCVRLFTTQDGGLEYKRSFPSTGSRVLSVAWGPRDDCIFAGCADSLIHCFDASSGQSLFDMRLETEVKGQDALVWALETLADGTIVSGDSYGRVQIWDGQTGTQLQSLSTHEADVLCLCVADEETEVFASGCDGKVVLLERSQPSSDSWDEHEDQDVDDGEVVGGSSKVSRRPRQGWEWSIGKVGPQAVEPLPPVPVAFLAAAPRLVLVMGSLNVDVWKIPKRPEKLADEADEQPRVVLRVEPKSEKGGHLACAAISADGGLIAVSNTRGTKLYRLRESDSSGGPLIASRVKLTGNLTPPAHALAFTADGRRLVVAAAAGDILVVELRGDSQPGGNDGSHSLATVGSAARLLHRFEEHVDGVGTGGGGASTNEGAVPISAVTLSVCGKWLVSASVSGVVHVFDLTTFRYHWTLPSFSNDRCVSVRFHCRHAVLACVDSTNTVRLLDVPGRRLAECHDYADFPKPPTGRGAWGGRGHVHPQSGVAFNPDDQLHSMLLFNHRSVMYVTTQRKVPDEVIVKGLPTGVLPPSHKSKKLRLSKSSGDGGDKTRAVTPLRKAQSNFKMIQDYSSVVLLDFLSKDELLVMENPWEMVRECLPDVLDRKQYGV